MKYLQTSFTMPQAQPDPAYCCERCVFGSGLHAVLCEFWTPFPVSPEALLGFAEHDESD